MGDKQRIGVRYCGGCNPRYDRVAVVNKLASLLPQAELVPAQAGAAYAGALVVCGCPSRCAGGDGLAVPPGRQVRLGGWEDLLPAKQRLEALLSAGGREAARLTGEQVQALLPHRPPMLFIDEVSRLIAGEEAEAVFFAAPGLPACQGHFPGGPVLPGVYLAEAAAQAAAVALMAGGRYGGKLPLLAGIRRAVFRRRVLPGETLEIYAAVTEERPELGWAACRGRVSVQGELAAELELCLAFR